ncbi:MAG: hypothetical protein LBB85_05500 [Dysgonamonadaceae bacterium]|jgi:hypothetical protein|nr:hypothetical protein [Dysgonamonadaceae bacterium]
MNNKKSRKWEGQKLALFIFEIAMSFFYLVFAVIFLFPSLLHLQFAPQLESIRVVLGAILGIYGIFRVYRIIKKLR